MKFFRNMKKYGAGATLGALAATSAHATDSALVTAASSALDQAKTDTGSVGGYVVAAVVGLVVISLIIAVVRKV